MGQTVLIAGDRSEWRRMVLLLAGFLGIYSAQINANVLAGRTPFQTGTALNVQFYHFPINFLQFPPAGSLTIGGVIGQDPLRFVYSYIVRCMEFGLGPMLLLTASPAMVRGTVHRRYVTILSVATLAFIPIQALGGSPRSSLPLLPVMIVEGVALLRWVGLRIQAQVRRRWMSGWIMGAMAGILVASTGLWRLDTCKSIVTGRLRESSELAEMEMTLKAAGVMNCRQVLHVGYHVLHSVIGASASKWVLAQI